MVVAGEPDVDRMTLATTTNRPSDPFTSYRYANYDGKTRILNINSLSVRKRGDGNYNIHQNPSMKYNTMITLETMGWILTHGYLP